MKQKIITYFQLSNHKSTMKKEFIGGISTFLAMAYILVVQPGMMSGYPVSLPFGGIYLATLISSFFATFLMGIFARVPISLAPGMGLNAFFAFTVCGILKINVYQALSTVLVSGWLYFLIVITPLRRILSTAFPRNLKLAIGVGIGIFIGFVGLQQTGIIQSDASLIPGTTKVISPVSVKLGNLENPLVLLAIFVLFLMIILHFLKIQGGIIIAMAIGIFAMLMMWLAGVDALQGEHSPFKFNDFKEQFNDFGDVAGQSYQQVWEMFQNPLAYIAIFVFLYVDFFDTTGTLFVLDQTANLSTNDQKQIWLKRANYVDAIGTIFGASIGTSTVTSYVESQVGVMQGARTGLASLWTSFCFLLMIFIYPIIRPLMPIFNQTVQKGVVPEKISPIAGPAVCIIGITMTSQLRNFNWKETIDIPILFMTTVFTALTYSIASGISIAIIAFTLLNLASSFHNLIVDRYKKRNTQKPIRSYFEKLNIPIVILCMIAFIYFGTSILYTSY